MENIGEINKKCVDQFMRVTKIICGSQLIVALRYFFVTTMTGNETRQFLYCKFFIFYLTMHKTQKVSELKMKN